MNLTRELAEKIVTKTMDVLGKNINIMNSQGIIIGSGDKNRLNTFHEVANQVIETQQKFIIKSGESKEFKGVREGINLPILFNKSIIGVVGITGKVAEVAGYGKIVKNMVELILQQEFLRHEIELDKKAKENFYQQLLNNEIKDQNLLADKAKLFKLNKNLNRVVYLIKFTEFNSKLVTNLTNRLNRLSFIKANDIFLIRGDNLVLIKSVNFIKNKIQEQKILELAKNINLKIAKEISDPKIGIGRTVNELSALHISYQEAKFALEIGEKLNFSAKNGIYNISEFGYDYLIPFIDDHHAQNFLNNLFRGNNKIKINELFNQYELGKIIDALIKNDLNISQTAKELYVHRNTLLYQLNKIRDETGYDLKNLSNLFTLLIGYHIFLFNK
ncbi:CdaR family transcriptional regulator [Halanaerobium salsuginis]|uniref:Carbohydrate diacid regulator n=1 Tax=Halanaerobium salsuginis TaxID=29563 RepID=A0A1I4IIR0_9FIRM|nr:sugar diacid recognition domain-containing protein [Halanaerobium salsuginis]SFL53977.1 carbohydrate diacid regulator [Halanaerobium salsuginis]